MMKSHVIQSPRHKIERVVSCDVMIFGHEHVLT